MGWAAAVIAAIGAVAQNQGKEGGTNEHLTNSGAGASDGGSGNTLGNSISPEKAQQQQHETNLAQIASGGGQGANQSPSMRPANMKQSTELSVPPVVGTGKGPQGDPKTVGNGKWKKANEVMGSNIGKTATSIGMKMFNDRRAEKQFRKQHSYTKTHGDFGGQGSFNSGPAHQPNLTDTGETARDRKVKQQGADTMAGRLKMDKEIQPYKIAHILMQSEQIAADVMMKRLQYDNFWAIKAATMGPENLKMAILMHSAEIDLEKMLTVAQPASPEEVDAYRAVYLLLQSEDGRIASEVKGLLGIGGMVSSAFGPKQ